MAQQQSANKFPSNHPQSRFETLAESIPQSACIARNGIDRAIPDTNRDWMAGKFAASRPEALCNDH
ncbi:hypothetical protein OAF42_03515 [Planctomicrobium sp.]|nr:hypothetical protein [Planctomicrobium sp.]MBT5019304.1 hypothetical protein [Planctomicrobium sp.]MDB4733491.1 hypothetical protein [Planctomicrobium sp.]